ncbi:MAG TPA: hypothetical protein VM925_34715 [Labilithrix sp.]|nr:hypothetical protein [Labilithrix sp.]
MKANLGIAGVLAAAMFVASSDARAAGHANGFGEKGELILSADRLVPIFNYSYASVTVEGPNNLELTTSRSGSGISFLFGRNMASPEDPALPINVHTLPRVAFDIAIIRSLTIGAGIAFGVGLGGTDEREDPQGNAKRPVSGDAPTMTAIGLTPRVGYVLPLGNLFAFWPRAGFGFYSISGRSEAVDGNGIVISTTKRTDTLFSLDLDPQFALVPFEHFFIHAGPIVNIPISGSRSVRVANTPTEADTAVFNFGLSAGLGGWFNVF